MCESMGLFFIINNKYNNVFIQTFWNCGARAAGYCSFNYIILKDIIMYWTNQNV